MTYTGYTSKRLFISSQDSVDIGKTTIAEIDGPIKQIPDFEKYLRYFDIDPVRMGYHWQIGPISKTQGWVLHLSVIRTQITEMLEVIIPFLIGNKCPFRIVKDYETAISALDGNLGLEYIGQVISIFPDTDESALRLAKELIKLTLSYAGPAIMTSIHLGAIVYTRYGSFGSGIKAEGPTSRYPLMHNASGKLIEDQPTIPFQLPTGISWPFSDILPYCEKRDKSILHGIYRPFDLLKLDPRGNVQKAHYIHSLFNVKTCVIKQGRQNMWSDDYGRDITDRLKWQKEIFEIISGSIKMPKIIDFFTEDNDTYMVMECVKGKSLFEHITETVNPNCSWWETLPVNSRITILDYLIRVTEIVKELHDLKIIHRDITPVNFLVNQKNEIVVIDLELAYSKELKKPWPPFQFGTFGFAAPEQQELLEPIVENDVYGLGAIVMTELTGIAPIAFDGIDESKFRSNLSFFIKDATLVKTLTSCLNSNPSSRPSLLNLYDTLQHYRQQVKSAKSYISLRNSIAFEQLELNNIIIGALKGLTSSPTVIEKGIWHFRIYRPNEGEEKLSKGFEKSPGLFNGIAGALYCIAKAKRAGFSTDHCKKVYDTNWLYLKGKYFSVNQTLRAGLSEGAPGIAVAIAEGIRANLIADCEANRLTIGRCLDAPSIGIDYLNGLAGHGFAILQCFDFFEKNELELKLRNIVAQLLREQDKHGDWVKIQIGREKIKTSIGYYHGNTGILDFLLEYIAKYTDEPCESCIEKSLKSLQIVYKEVRRQYQTIGFRKHLIDVNLRDGFCGLIKVLLKSYRLLEDNNYKELAENLLADLPAYVVNENFGRQYGLACIGDLYIEAFTILKDPIWLDRATWIASVLLHTYKNNGESGLYWLSQNQTISTASLMEGNSGIISFLINYWVVTHK